MANITTEQEELYDHLKERLETSPFWRYLGIQIDEMREGFSRITFNIDEENHINSYDSMHGGIAPALLDSASSVAIRTKLKKFQPIATTNLSVNYTKAAYRGRLIIEGHVTTLGRKMATATATVYGEGTDKIIATSMGSFMIFPVK